MTNAAVLKRSLPARRLVGLIAALVALSALALPALAAARPTATRLPKPAVLTFKVAKVGQPGNHAVAIVPFTSALYSNCSEAPANPTAPGTKLPDPCQEVGSVGYEYGIGEVEVTVEQYVAFLNTVDPFGRNQMNLYSPDESGTAWPRFGQIDYSGAGPRRQALHGRGARMERQALRLRQLPPRRPLRQLGRQRQDPLEERIDARLRQRRIQVRHLQGGALPQNRDRHVRHAQARPGADLGIRLRHPQPERVDQGRLLRPHRRRHLLLLVVPDQRRQPVLRRRLADPGDAQPGQRRRHQRRRRRDGGQLPRRRRRKRRSGARRTRPRKTAKRSTRCTCRRTPTRRPSRAASTRSARPRPTGPGARSNRAATRSSGPTRSPRPRSGPRVTGSGGASTAASPTRRSTSSGSRRSACSRRTTNSSLRPTRGSGSGSA